ncbi:phosphotransferase family protein [Rhodoplanes sp. Z2-YC6860]|uniref:phosphotransferase family protein n=1 Tax=Rhodoplanes sp. Z2-YC6860 TaxID=674703 RepID=UPI00078D0928|nr:phosphotransferase family protein [Rhodoplanes sp. Z2-YC6860]AMN39993.1 aminoglycoside phosphotransferase [Rhodoplanes sp. Z2-YC6860]
MQKIDRQVAFTGTKDVAEPLRFDPARLEGYLAREVKGFAGPLTVSQFKGGQSNPTYRLDTPGRQYVLRRKPPGKLLPSAHAVDREFRIITALAGQGFPVAEPVIYCADESVTGTAFYVMGFVPGRVFWNPEMPGSHPKERAAVYAAMNGAMARLHSFDPAAIGLGDFGRGENYVARQVERWSKQYRSSETQKIDEMERLIAWLPSHIPPACPPRLVHGDYRLDNMILDAHEPKVLAVLDWELSTIGDPLADFTYHLMQWHMPQEDTGAGTGSLVGHDLAALGIPSMAEYVEMYRKHTGLDPRPYLAAYLAYNFFRIAAILQGIAGRVRDGTATNEHAAAKGQMVRPLAETAWRFAREAGAK